MGKDRFDLEQDILNCWNITSELRSLYDNWDSITDDKKKIIIIGIIQLYDMKFNSMFRLFETLVHERKIL